MRVAEQDPALLSRPGKREPSLGKGSRGATNFCGEAVGLRAPEGDASGGAGAGGPGPAEAARGRCGAWQSGAGAPAVGGRAAPLLSPAPLPSARRHGGVAGSRQQVSPRCAAFRSKASLRKRKRGGKKVGTGLGGSVPPGDEPGVPLPPPSAPLLRGSEPRGGSEGL